MFKPTRIFLVFLLIFVVGFLAVYLYIKVFLNQQTYAIDAEMKAPVSFISTFL